MVREGFQVFFMTVQGAVRSCEYGSSRDRNDERKLEQGTKLLPESACVTSAGASGGTRRRRFDTIPTDIRCCSSYPETSF